jgi:hypothetical protein
VRRAGLVRGDRHRRTLVASKKFNDPGSVARGRRSNRASSPGGTRSRVGLRQGKVP